MQRRVVEAIECGATEVCLQGGIHPDFDGDYYVWTAPRGQGGRAGDPCARLHRAGGDRRRPPARHAAARLSAASEGSRPRHAPRHRGGDPRRRGAGDHLPRQGQHRRMAVRAPDRARGRPESNVTIMYGTVERPVHVARHLVRTRHLQKETGGFTEFVPLPFVHMATPDLHPGQRARPGPTFREVVAHPRGRSHRCTATRSPTCRRRGSSAGSAGPARSCRRARTISAAP